MEILISAVELMLKIALFCISICLVYWIASRNKAGDESSSPALPMEQPAETSAPKIFDASKIKFQFQVKNFVQVLLNDPSSREEVYAAVREGAANPTDKLGNAVLDDQVYSLFIQTNQQKESGDSGFIYRTQDGSRVQACLKLQAKNAPAVLPGVHNDPELINKVIDSLNLAAAKARIKDKKGV